MNVKRLLIVLTIILSFPLYSRDITPQQNFGKLQVVMPKLNTSLSKLEKKNIKIKFIKDGKFFDIEPSKLYSFSKGKGCLRIENVSKDNPYMAKACNIQIKPRQKVVYTLSALLVSWKKEIAEVNLGPQPSIHIKQVDTNYFKDSVAVISPKKMHSAFFILPSNNYNFKLYHKDLIDLDNLSVALAQGEVIKRELDFNDKRGEIQVHMNDLPRSLPSLSSNYIALVYRKSNKKIKRLKPSPWSSVDSFGPHDQRSALYIGNFFGVDYNEPITTVYAYPLKSKIEKYQIIVNELADSIHLEAKKRYEYSITTINVQNFENEKEGFFELFAKRESLNNSFVNLPWIVSSSNKPVKKNQMFSTGHSVDLLEGFKYRFDFYQTDDSNMDTLQDSSEVDLSTY